jgi:histidyl-tRNA synthetase
VGEKELQDGVVTRRRMADGRQEAVKLTEVAEWIKT